MRALGVVLLGAVTLLLLVAVQALPPLRAVATPLGGHVDRHYREHTLDDMATPNVVTSVLADYRGYDTFGETTVIFAAGLSVYLLLRRRDP